jgi:hypothetical protein
VATQNPVTAQDERQKLTASLEELAKSRRAYANNPAALAMIEGRIKRIRDRIRDLEWQAARGR